MEKRDEEGLSSGMTRALTAWQTLSFGVGHFFNDLCLTMWYSYFLVYLRYVLKVSNDLSGLILMTGLLSDALCTPLVGFWTDRSSGLWNHIPWFRRHGKRKSVHLIGSTFVLIFFPLLFSECWGCPNGNSSPPTPQFLIYLSLVAVFFQGGWATVQVSHLSMIPELSPNSLERMELGIVRTSFDVLTRITVYGLAYIIFTSGESGGGIIDVTDDWKFRNIALIITCIGVVFTILFHIGTPDKHTTLSLGHPTEQTPLRLRLPDKHPREQLNEKEEKTETQEILPPTKLCKMKWSDWFRKREYYQVALLLGMGRIFVNSSASILPLYLQEELQAPKILLAIVPLVVNLSGFVFTFLIKFISTLFLSKKDTSLLGATFAFIGCIWLSFDSDEGISSGRIYGVCCLMGIGGVTMVILALSFASDLIGENTESGAFVFGSIASFEKLTNGLFILIVQLLREYWCKDCPGYYRNVISHGVSLTAVVSILVVLTLHSQEEEENMNLGQTQTQTWSNRSFTRPNTTTTKTPISPNIRNREFS